MAQASADFISCVSFGRTAEFAEKYFRQGLKIAVTGRIQTGSYTNRDGQKVYTTEVVVEEQEFAESKSSSGCLCSIPSSEQCCGTIYAYTKCGKCRRIYEHP